MALSRNSITKGRDRILSVKVLGVAEKWDDLERSFKSSHLHFIPTISNA
jgi:hypothetical protein